MPQLQYLFVASTCIDKRRVGENCIMESHQLDYNVRHQDILVCKLLSRCFDHGYLHSLFIDFSHTGLSQKNKQYGDKLSSSITSDKM